MQSPEKSSRQRLGHEQASVASNEVMEVPTSNLKRELQQAPAPAGPAPSPIKGAPPRSGNGEGKQLGATEAETPATHAPPLSERKAPASGAQQARAEVKPKVEEAPSPAKPAGEQGAGMGQQAGQAIRTGIESARTAVGSGYGAAKAVGSTALKGAEVAGDTAEAVMGVADVAKGVVGKGAEAVADVTEGVQMAAERTASWASWGQGQAYQVGSTAYQSTIQPFASFLWWLFITLPYTSTVWVATAAWNSVSWVWDTAVYTGVFIATNSSATINRCADVGFRLILGSLRTVNKSMDQLVNFTPHLIKDTLESASQSSARQAPAEHPEPAEEVESEDKQQKQPARTAVKEERFDMPKETNVARAANEALHRVFDQQQDFADDRGTLLAEARKLAWHSWMLVALQVTALRIVLKVTEGMLGWVARAWLQLITAGIILAVMAAATPIAASAAALAFVCHQMLKQYGLRLQGFLVPPLHNAMVAVNNMLAPYLAPPHSDVFWEPEGEEESEAEEQGAEEQAGEAAPVERRSKVEGEGVEGEEEAEEVGYEEQQPETGLLLGVLPTSIRQVKGLLAGLLNAGEHFTASLLPNRQWTAVPQEGEEPESGSILSSTTTANDVATASEHSAEAWNKASALATATAFTVLDTLRVILLGLSTRFNVSLPEWIPGLTPDKEFANSPAMAAEPMMVQFNETAGKGPISGAHAVGAASLT